MTRKESPVRKLDQEKSPALDARPAATDLHLWQIVAVQDLFWVLLLASTVAALYLLRSVFVPVLVALTLAYLFDPVITYAESHWRLRRTMASLTAVTILVALFYGLIAWLGPIIAEQMRVFAEKAPRYLERVTGRHGVRIGSLSEHLSRIVAQVKDDPVSTLSGTGQAVGLIGFLIGKLSNLMVDIVVIPIYLFFFCAYYDRMTRVLASILPVSRQARILALCRRMDAAVSGFFRGRFLIAAISTCLFLLTFALADLPYWALLGVITGILTLIPYISLIGWPLAVGLKYLDVTSSGDPVAWITVVGWPSLAYIVPAFIEGWVLTPWIQGQTMEMSAMTVLLVLFIGGVIGGAVGIFVSIPVAACLKILMQELVLPRIRRWAREH